MLPEVREFVSCRVVLLVSSITLCNPDDTLAKHLEDLAFHMAVSKPNDTETVRGVRVVKCKKSNRLGPLKTYRKT